MALAPQGKQPMSKDKGKAGSGSGGAGGGPSTKAAGSSGQGSSRPSASPSRPIGFRTEEDAVQAAPPLAAEAADGAQQTEPAPAGGGKKEKEKLRKERQRQRKVEEAWEALQGAVESFLEAAGSVDAVEEAMQAALKHEARSEKLAALVAEAKELIEQARAAEAERARAAAEAAAEAAAAAAAVEAAERLRLEEEVAVLTLRMQGDALRMQSDALRLQQAQAQLGVPPAAPAPHPDAEESLCVVCMDVAKDRAVRPCMHMCVCEACSQLLMLERTPRCPVCREPIQHIERVFW
jgi:hypothetical protein